MSRVGIIACNGFYVAKETEKTNSNIIMQEKAEMLTKLYQQLTQNFLDILVLKKLKERQMRLCELAKSLRKELFIPIDIKRLHKTIKAMKERRILEIHEIGGKRFYSLTEKGRKIIEIIQKRQHQIQEMVSNVVQVRP